MENRIEALIQKGLKSKAEFDKELATLADAANNNPDYKKSLKQQFTDSLNKRGEEIKELSVRVQIENVAEMISLAYIARHYFSKSRSWLMQRINGYTVNGKKATFTTDELETLNRALQDVSKRIGAISIV